MNPKPETLIFLKETFVNASKGYRYATIDTPYEAFTNNKRRLFQSLQKEYGRCTGYVYIDLNGKSQSIGWVFSKTVQYTDCQETYIQEVWVTLHTRPDTVTRTEHFIYLKEVKNSGSQN